jgi:3-dehydroquinate dehydratase II
VNVLVINGPNLNLLGEREPEIYGRKTLRDLEREVSAHARKLRQRVRFFQSNHEGEIVDELHRLRKWADAIVINPAAFTHYSYAIRDALKAVARPAVEVHLSDVESRAATEGDFRKISVVRDVCAHRFTGEGIGSYLKALDALAADRAAARKRRR